MSKITSKFAASAIARIVECGVWVRNIIMEYGYGVRPWSMIMLLWSMIMECDYEVFFMIMSIIME